MNGSLVRALLLVIPFLLCSAVCSADFKEAYWENYAEIHLPASDPLPPLGGLMLDPSKFQGSGRGDTFSDIRVLTRDKAEVPYQIISRAPVTRTEAVPVHMKNLSLTPGNETLCIGQIEQAPVTYNVVEVLTADKGFFRQVSISGSMDGRQWNMIKPNGVVFDYVYSPEDAIRHVRIKIPDSTYPFLEIRIMNKQEAPLSVKGLSVSYVRTDPGSEEQVGAWLSSTEQDIKNRQSILMVSTSSLFPVGKIDLLTQEKNFRRKVEVFTRAGNGDWTKWAEDIIFSFQTDTVNEAKLQVLFPEIASRELKLVIRNYDSPPLAITGIRMSGHRRTLVFKLDARQRYFIFWGNPTARGPQYDIAELVSRHAIDAIPAFSVGPALKNPGFTDPSKRLPFTERFTYLIYGVVALLIFGLIAWQYRIIKKTV
ncbi:MAG: DUF3999 family protein [Nitrospirae bacterium]|nr:MAG: DUF3999 family protein [Nitrospirota bacterium]